MHSLIQRSASVPLRKNSAFLRAFFAHMLSSLGDWLDFIAMLTLFTYIWKAEPMLISILPVAYALPGILFSQIAGVWVDRWNSKNVLIYTDALRSGCTLLLLFAPSPPWMLSLLLLRASIGVFHLPAQQSIVRRLVPESQLLEATALIGTSLQIIKIIGPMLGASLLALSSYQFCLLLTAGCFIISVFLLFFLSLYSQNAKNQDGKASSFYVEWREGWNAVLANRLLFLCLLFSFAVTTVIQIIDIQMAVLLRDIKPEYHELPGWIIASIGLGAVCSTAVFSKIKQSFSYILLVSSGALLMGIAVFFFGLLRTETSLFYFLAAGSICGIGTGLSFIGIQFCIQKETSTSAIGRIYGIYHSIFNFLLIGAPLLGGWLVKAYGVATIFLICGLTTMLLGILGFLLWKRLRKTKSTGGERIPSLLQ